MTVIDNKLIKLWPIFILVSLWVIFSSPYLFRGLVPFPSKYLVSFFPPWSASYAMPVKNNAMPDVITQIYPWKKLTMETWRQGEIPLWNPFSFSGTTHAANYQSAAFTPMNLLFFFLPFIDAWSLLILFQPLLAGLFMYLFLRELTCSQKASTIGSVGFMFSGFLVTWMAYGTLGYAALCLPLILWSIRKFIRTGSNLAYAAGCFGIAWSFVSGHFQISIYVLVVSLSYLLYESIRAKEKKRGYALGFMFLLGLLLTSPQLLLTYEAFQASVRSVTNTQLKEVIPWQYIVTFFSPDFFGNPVTRNDWFGHYAEWAGFVGVIPLILSLYAMFYGKRTKKVFFIVLFLISLLLAYLSPLSIALFQLKIPVLSTSAASRIIVITSFSLSVLAALGFDQLTEDWKNSVWRKRKAVLIGILIGVVSVWGVVYIIKPLPTEWLLVAKRNLILPTLMVIVSGLAIAFGFVKRKQSIQIAGLALLLLTCFDSYRYASKWMPFDPKEYIYPQVKVITALQKDMGYYRIFGNIGNEVGSLFQIPLIEGYDAMYQARYGEFINATSNGIVNQAERSVVQFDKHGKYALQALQLLGVKYIVHRISDARNIWAFPYWQYTNGEFKSLHRDEHYELFEYRDVFPRTYLASSYVVKKDDQEIIDTLFHKDFDRRNSVVLEEMPSISPEYGEGRADIVSYTPTSVTIKTSASVPKLLFLSDVYDDEWKATVDGKEEKILRADYNFRVVPLPKGDHVVEFRYHPIIFRYGLICVAFAVFLIMIFIVSRKKKFI